MSEELNFDLSEAFIPLNVGGERYLLVEADGAAGTEYRNAGAKGIKFNAQGKPCGIDNIIDAQLVLVSKCLFKLTKENNEASSLKSWIDPTDSTAYFRQPVNIERIRSWPDRITQALFEKARDLSGMKDENETAKNS